MEVFVEGGARNAIICFPSTLSNTIWEATLYQMPRGKHRSHQRRVPEAVPSKAKTGFQAVTQDLIRATAFHQSHGNTNDAIAGPVADRQLLEPRKR